MLDGAKQQSLKHASRQKQRNGVRDCRTTDYGTTGRQKNGAADERNQKVRRES
jgi:hypothetical protein